MEASEGRPDLEAAIRDVCGVDHVLRYVFVGDGLEVRRALLPFAQAFLATHRIDGPVVHERQEERAERTTGRIERLWRTPQRQEGLVHDVLGKDLLPGQR